MSDFKAEPAALRQAMEAAYARVVASGWYVLGDECARFERAWAATCGTCHALGVANGMDAIELVLRALGVGPGDEVITTPMTAFATVLAVMRAGATPVLADIELGTGLLDPRSVERCLSPRTRVVLLVHLYGQVRGMDRWQRLCREAGVALVEDCAQSHLARAQGKTAGAFGVAGAYSFYPTKNLGAIGDAGAVVTDSKEIASKVAVLRNYGQSERYHHPLAGMNSRLDELQAALLSVRLEWLDRFTRRRIDIAGQLAGALRNPIVRLLDPAEEAGAHVYHLFVVRCRKRDALAAHLRSAGVQSLIHYPVPAHLQPPCRTLRIDPQGLANAQSHAAECLSLPCHPQMSDDDVAQVADAVNAFAP
jgi:dTDP-4-amino-4,6-dideoxygalactose transaminase